MKKNPIKLIIILVIIFLSVLNFFYRHRNNYIKEKAAFYLNQKLYEYYIPLLEKLNLEDIDYVYEKRMQLYNINEQLEYISRVIQVLEPFIEPDYYKQVSNGEEEFGYRLVDIMHEINYSSFNLPPDEDERIKQLEIYYKNRDLLFAIRDKYMTLSDTNISEHQKVKMMYQQIINYYEENK